jgi:diguanylate cyclase (GGDEF)-like protein
MANQRENAAAQNELLRSEEIQKQLQCLASRDLQLWSVGLLVILVLSAGFLALVFPNLSWRTDINVDGRLIPQFFFGLIALVVLFNIYIVGQKRTMNATRRELIRELVFNERMESMSLVDATTQLFNRRGIDQLLTQEVARANRMGSALSLLILKLDSLSVINARHGMEAGDKFTAEFANLMRRTFRGSDTLARYTGNQFLVIMPGTGEQQAEIAVRRFQEAVEQWNLTTKTGWEMTLVCGISSHRPGCDAGDVLRAVERKILPQREKFVPMFVPVTPESGKPSHFVV